MDDKLEALRDRCDERHIHLERIVKEHGDTIEKLKERSTQILTTLVLNLCGVVVMLVLQLVKQ
jgi:cell division protein ZapA (FtsZ GTPase activity inhibitor)